MKENTRKIDERKEKKSWRTEELQKDFLELKWRKERIKFSCIEKKKGEYFVDWKREVDEKDEVEEERNEVHEWKWRNEWNNFKWKLKKKKEEEEERKKDVDDKEQLTI